MPVAGLNPGPVIDFEQPSVFAAPARCGHSEPRFGMSEYRQFAGVISCTAIPGFPNTALRKGTKS